MPFMPKRMKQLRERRGYSQRDLAEICGVGIGSISMWESGSRNPKQEALENLARALKCDVYYLTGKTDVPITLTNTSFIEADLSEKELQLFTLLQMLGEGSDDVYEEIKIVLDEIKKEKSAPSDGAD
jgi:transcriptional regulator with XRE-family HTH domain